MEDWQSLAAIAVVLATAAIFVMRLIRRGKGCAGCGGTCVPKPGPKVGKGE